MESTIRPLRGVDRWGLPAALVLAAAAWTGGAGLLADDAHGAGLTIGAAVAVAVLPVGVAITMLLDPMQYWLRQPERMRDSFLVAAFHRRARMLFAVAVISSVVAVCGAVTVVVAELLDRRIGGDVIGDLIVLGCVGGLAWFAVDVNRANIVGPDD
jgi:hypothetical protein